MMIIIIFIDDDGIALIVDHHHHHHAPNTTTTKVKYNINNINDHRLDFFSFSFERSLSSFCRFELIECKINNNIIIIIRLNLFIRYAM